MTRILPTRRELGSWMMYDWANSAFATTIMAVIFNKYYAGVVARGEQGVTLLGVHLQGAALFSFIVAIAMGIVALIAPALGAIADYSGNKKKFLLYFCMQGALATMFLYWVGPGEYIFGGVVFIIAMVGFASANVFYNAFLPELSDDATIGRVSGRGWALGYVGGGLLLVLNLWMIHSGLFGTQQQALHWCFVSVGIWWLLFSLPLVVWLKEQKKEGERLSKKQYLILGYRQVWHTLGMIRKRRQLFRFLTAFLIYNDGIQTVIIMASIFGAQVLGMNTQALILYFLTIQFTAFVGSFFMGTLADKFGSKRVIMVCLVGWCLVVGWAYTLGIVFTPLTEYWIIGVLAGLVMGGSQAASRSLAGVFTPQENAAEFFGFYAVADKFASILGPLVYGIIIAVTGSLRTGLLSIGVFFIVGMVILATVDVAQGQKERLIPNV